MVRPISEHFTVAIEQAVQAVQRQVPQRIAARTESVYPASLNWHGRWQRA